MTDFIGDIHGHADKLETLLRKLGYRLQNRAYRHSERQVVFLGDYIDRGPKIKETLNIVRRMVDNGDAIALMGNHEYNAICYNTRNENGKYLRRHGYKNTKQHIKTLRQLGGFDSHTYKEYISWFMTLPVFYETDQFRAVHATWDEHHINRLGKVLKNQRFTDDIIRRSAEKSDELFDPVNDVLKGRELTVPSWSFPDKEGHMRTEIRVKWWVNPVGMTYKQLSVETIDALPDKEVDPLTVASLPYYQDSKPVFFGHYWMKGTPRLQQENICCADFSVAKEGVLAAYKFDGEGRLEDGKFSAV